MSSHSWGLHVSEPRGSMCLLPAFRWPELGDMATTPSGRENW